MKKIKHTWFVSVLAMITVVVLGLALSSCGMSPAYPIVDTGSVKYCREGIADFGFNINVVTDSKEIDVEFVSFSGENVDSLEVSLANDTWDSLKELKIKGSYLKMIGFVCHTEMDHVRIDSVKLIIDGVEREYCFDDPITHFVSDDEGAEGVYILNSPSLISVASLNPVSGRSTEYQFLYKTDKNITVTDFGFNSFFECENATVYIDGEVIGSLSDSLPLDVDAESEIKIISKIQFSSNVEASYIENVYCNYFLSYESDGVEYCINNPIICQSAINVSDAENIVKSLIESASAKNK